MLCIFSVTPSETVNITVVDSIDNSVIATTTVPKNSNIANWLNSLTFPTHEGYAVSTWEITTGDITNVTNDATVYIRYTELGGGTSGGGTVPETVAIMVIDSINNSPVFNGYVNKNSDITNILNTITIPTHEGYVFDRWETDGDDITNITKNTRVYIRYTQSGGGTVTQSISTYVNGDGDISINAADGGWDFTGSATIAIQMSKSFDSVEYDSYDIMEFSTADGENGAKTDAVISGDTITFTDEKIETHSFYRIGLFDTSGNRVGQTAWDAGFKPIKITITVDGTPHEYNIVSN